MAPRRPLEFDPITEAKRQWRRHRWDGPAWMAAATSIMRAQQLVLREVDDALRPFGLTFARYESLVLLYFSHAHSLPLGKMGDRLMVHPASVTNAINQLERDGLVQRVHHATDRRKILAQLTDKGREVVESATEAVTKTRFGLADLRQAEADELTELIMRLRTRAGDFDLAEDDGPRRAAAKPLGA